MAALADARLGTDHVDGLMIRTIGPIDETDLVRVLGIPEICWSSRVPYGGSGSQGVLLHAASSVASGAADAVLAYRSLRARSGARFGAETPQVSWATSAHSGTTATQWVYPYGVLTPASWMSLNATRYMHRFAVSSEDFGQAVVQLRGYAATNPIAHLFGKPIALADHQASRWIPEPCIRHFDCCQKTDGSVVLTLEAVSQPRGEAANQLDGPEVALVSARRTETILRRP